MKSPKVDRKLYSNKLGLLGWVYGGSYRTERYLYTLHRVTGLGILVYLLMHIAVTWFKNDPVMWTRLMQIVEHPLLRMGEYCVFFGVFFHALNGIRLIIGEFGLMLGKPVLPVYPYPLALLRQRPLMVALMAVTAVVVLYGAFDVFRDLFMHS
jgi:succinate dehydrogenase / fumarate reductase cytochrome b subunit